MSKKILAEDEKFEALFQYASMGILVANEDGEIILANKFLLQLFGYSNQDLLLGKKVECLIPSRYHHKHTHYRDNYNHKPENRPMGTGRDLFAVKSDGTEFPVEISLSSYRSGDKAFAIAFITDITRRKQAELAVQEQGKQLEEKNRQIELLNDDLEEKVEQRTRELKETLNQLEESKEELTRALNKAQELNDLKSRFVSTASHEFRTPLTTILSSATLVSKYTETNQQANRDKHIQRINSSVKNMIVILNEFLTLGKMEDGKLGASFKNFSLPELLQSLINEMEPLLKNEQHIDYKHTGTADVYLDPSLLKNSLLNLLSNAIKFSPENSPIILASTVSKKEIKISVKDSGVGISAEDQQHLFERFFRGANAVNIQGTGLGLHIVSKYAELMNGKISFSSKLNKGSEFILKFENKKEL